MRSRSHERLEENPDPATSRRLVPHAERSAAAGSRRPSSLFDRSLRSSKVQEHESRDDRVERLILERQCSRVSMHELDARYVGAGIREHRVGEVDANRLRTALGRPCSDIAGACRDIEEPCPPACAHHIQERRCDLRCHAAQEPVVGGRLLRRPAGFLERIERVGVVVGHTEVWSPGWSHRSGTPTVGGCRVAPACGRVTWRPVTRRRLPCGRRPSRRGTP